jgi:hypothetical protein
LVGIEPVKHDLKIMSVSQMAKENSKGSVRKYKMVAKDKNGLVELTIVSAAPFQGYSPKDGVIQVAITQSQKALSDFVVVKMKGAKKKEDK